MVSIEFPLVDFAYFYCTSEQILLVFFLDFILFTLELRGKHVSDFVGVTGLLRGYTDLSIFPGSYNGDQSFNVWPWEVQAYVLDLPKWAPPLHACSRGFG